MASQQPIPTKGTRVSIIGAGKSGLAAAALLKKLGAQVFISDQKNASAALPPGIEAEWGKHTDRLLQADLLIRSPGVSGHLPVLQKAHRLHLPMWSEMELAARLVHPCQLIAITGTNGKTTTTTLVGEIFKAAGRPTLVGGNIGTPLSSLVPKVRSNSILILETSSYQLENIEMFHPSIAAILNIAPNHLDHHGSLKAYAEAKARIFMNQTAQDVCILNAEDPQLVSFKRRVPSSICWFSRQKILKTGVYYQAGRISVRWKRIKADFDLKWSLPGDHNIENALAATAIAIVGGVSPKIIQRVLQRFRGVEHRLEFVRTVRDVRYINDSKSTTVDATRVALEAFDKPVVLIMGGQGKGAPYRPLRSLLKDRVTHLLLIGEDAVRIAGELGPYVFHENLRTLSRAVQRARTLAHPGQVVLFSPACASFDQYTNFEERGQHFKKLVKGLKT